MALQQVGIAGNEAGLVATLPQRAGPVVGVVDVPNIATAKRLHHPADAATLARGHEQVHVVGHQHIGMDAATFVQCDLVQVMQVATIVFGLEEAGLAIVAALDHMLRDAGQADAREAWHPNSPWIARSVA